MSSLIQALQKQPGKNTQSVCWTSVYSCNFSATLVFDMRMKWTKDTGVYGIQKHLIYRVSAPEKLGNVPDLIEKYRNNTGTNVENGMGATISILLFCAVLGLPVPK